MIEIDVEKCEQYLKSRLDEEAEKIGRLKMLTNEEVAECFGTTVQTVANLRNTGLLKFIRIGKQFMYSQESILDFERRYEGVDLSNVEKMKKAYKALG